MDTCTDVTDVYEESSHKGDDQGDQQSLAKPCLLSSMPSTPSAHLRTTDAHLSSESSVQSDGGVCSQLTEDVVWSFLDDNPCIVDKWLKDRLSDEMGRGLILRGISDSHRKAVDLSACPSDGDSKSPSPDPAQHLSLNYCSTRSNSICSWRSPKAKAKNAHTSSTKVERLSEPELFTELIRDISSELDIDTLCHKILVNVGHLTHADRASLFLAHGSNNNKYLIAKLFDVTQDSPLEQALTNAKEREILLPWGVGIVGHVASTKEVINIKDAYQDARFDRTVDERTGYRTTSVLCMPVCSFEGEVIGVAQIINKTNGTKEFTPQDVQVFQRYLAFCGIGIQNAQLFDMSVREYKRNQMLLQLARGIFEEQTSLERLVTKIMTDSRELLKCERCAVYLLDTEPSNKQEPITSASNLLSSLENTNDRPVLIKSQSFSSLDSLSHSHIPHPPQSEIPSPRYVLQNKRQNLSFYTAFELRSSKNQYQIIRPTSAQLATSAHVALAKYVCSVGRTINISDVQGWMGMPMQDEGLLTFSVLTVPIFNSTKQILGVAQMINKENGLHFSEYDISTFEAFATFCGLGIQNTQVYEKACRLMARQQVALECLSYHATASGSDTESLAKSEIPASAYFNLFSYDFHDFSLSDEDTCRCTIRMFMELHLLESFNIPYEVLCRWILSVKKNYRPVKYHNWRHAITVCQTMFAILKTGKMEQFMTDLEMLGLLVACLSHDLDHRGTNNSFQTKTDSPLAILYTTSTMEHHHFDQCVMILSQDQNNIFQSLSSENYRKVMHVVENSILSTDMGLYFKKKDTFLDLSDNGEFDWQSPDKKELLCGMMMTACDVSAIAKPWEIQHRVAKLVADEFFEQGDMERLKLNQEPVAMMDREKKDELPKMQVGFINFICLPLYKALSESFPWVKPLYDGCAKNREHWERLSEQVDMGLTWIDYEEIENPVEKDRAEVISQITLNQKAMANPALTSTKPQLIAATSTEKDARAKRMLGNALRSRSLKAGVKRRSVEKRLDRVVDSCITATRLTKDTSIEEEPINIPPPAVKSAPKNKRICTIL